MQYVVSHLSTRFVSDQESPRKGTRFPLSSSDRAGLSEKPGVAISKNPYQPNILPHQTKSAEHSRISNNLFY